MFYSLQYIYRVAAKKVSHYQMVKNLYEIVSKPVNEIDLFVDLKYESISITIILFFGSRYSMRDLLSDLSNYG